MSSRRVVLALEAAVRVRNLLRAHPFSEPGAKAVVAEYEELVARVEQLLAQKDRGEAEAEAAVRLLKELRSLIKRVPLKALAAVGRAAKKDRPELERELAMPRHGRITDFLVSARGVAERAGTNLELLQKYGIKPEQVKELEDLLDRYETVLITRDRGRRGHTGARREVEQLVTQVLARLKLIDGLMVYEIRQQPDLAGAWASARNLPWPNRRKDKPLGTGGVDGKVSA